MKTITKTKNCIICKKQIVKTTHCGRLEWKYKKYCSRPCKYLARENSIPWNKGIPSPFVEELSASWKGDKVGYHGIHKWVQKWKGKPCFCENCGRTDLEKHNYHWANVDHKYRRVLDDYIRFCVQCHVNYDKEHKLK